MSWDAANEVLYSARPSTQQLAALQRFCDEHAAELRDFSAPAHAALRPALARFISKLFELLEYRAPEPGPAQRALHECVVHVSAGFTRSAFFPPVFAAALRDADEDLLELVYSALFTEIVFTSELTLRWFEEVCAVGPLPTEAAYALQLLVCVQFIDVRQDWKAVRPPVEFLLKLHALILKTNNVTLRLVWMLAVYTMAQAYEFDDTDEFDKLLPLLRSLQTDHGVHWSVALRDEIAASVAGVAPLMLALELVRPPRVIARQILAQSVADVLSTLLTVCSPSEELCRDLASAVRRYPALQTAQWVSSEALELMRAKCPAVLASLVYVAQALDVPARAAFFSELSSYVCAVPVRALDSDVLGAPVRAVSTITILPPRVSDGQGALELEAGASGTLLAIDGDDALVLWQFVYNGWSLLGRVWENADVALGCSYDAPATEILRLVASTPDVDVLAALSAGLARGDVVDFVARRLQLWLHSRRPENHVQITLALEFLANLVPIDSARVWAILSELQWPEAEPCKQRAAVLVGVAHVVQTLWPTFDPQLSVHAQVVDTVAQTFSWHYCALSSFAMDASTACLRVFKLLLPQHEPLKDVFLSAAPARETYFEPLMASLDNKRVLDFCIFLLTSAARGPGIHARELLCIDRQLFQATKKLTSLYVSERKLRARILKIWSLLSVNTEAPPLLAFVEKENALKLKQALVQTTEDKLESDRMVANIAFFLASARHEEGLLELLADPIVSNIQNRATCIEDKTALRTVLHALLELKCDPHPVVVSFLLEIISNDPQELVDLAIKEVAIKIVTKAYHASVSKDAIRDFVELENSRMLRVRVPEDLKAALSEQLPETADYINVGDATLSLRDTRFVHNPQWRALRKELGASLASKGLAKNQTQIVTSWCDLLCQVAKDGDDAQKHVWALSLLQCNDEAASPMETQDANSVRTETASVLLIDAESSSSPLSVDVALEALAAATSQLTDITTRPSFALTANNTWLLELLKVEAILLARLGEDQAGSAQRVAKRDSKRDAKLDEQLKEIASRLLSTVVLPQLTLIEPTERTLLLHLSLIMDSLKVLRRPGAAKHDSAESAETLNSIVQLFTDSDTDYALLQLYGNTKSVAEVAFGDTVLRHIYEWLQIDAAADGFLRKGLNNVLVDAPLSRGIQKGDVTASENGRLHTVWISLLSISLRLLTHFGARYAEDACLFLTAFSKQLCTCVDQWKAGLISLSLVDETMLIFTFWSKVRALTPAAADSKEIHFDSEELRKNVDLMLSHEKYSHDRLAPSEDKNQIMTVLKELSKALNVKKGF